MIINHYFIIIFAFSMITIHGNKVYFYEFEVVIYGTSLLLKYFKIQMKEMERQIKCD